MPESQPSVHLAPVPEPVINGLEIPDQLAVTRGLGVGALGAAMGMLMVQLSPEHSIAVMPVAPNTQPFGLLHGGANCVLGESLGSVAASLHAGEGRYAVGIDINATHTGSATSGWVTGECRAIHLGGSMTVHEVVITNANGRRCSTVRITNMLRTRR
ncbi:PaaI family thioesterase [Gulosibacter sediminis]|uniref:PaaI family thioesterase n=1 Tax=Gulosibacter sediminis TaxID=1729695 RepID=UPI0024A9A47E|nr:hotdog fold thioesterase [Gulosibacter sediminis]